VLIGVHFKQVDVDKTHIGVLEDGFRSGGEIRITRANADYQVGFQGNAVGSQRAGGANGPQAGGMIIGQ
jgi:hypothetical protein